MIKENILKIRERIYSACLKNNADPGRVILVAVAKNRSMSQVAQALVAGISDIGENKVQEALLKYADFSSRASQVRWHMVGHLQTNKVKEAVKIFDLIHSVDSLRLAQEIDKQAARINKVQDILIEVKTSPEESKFGLKPEEAIEVIREALKLSNISIKGLMTIAPPADSPEGSRLYFRMLRELKDKINASRLPGQELEILSMGMTDDFETAIEEGSNMVRIGRAIFGG